MIMPNFLRGCWRRSGRPGHTAVAVAIVAGSLGGIRPVPAPAQVIYSVFPAQPATQSSQQPTRRSERLVSLSVHDSTVEYVIASIARQAGMRVAYRSKTPELAKRVTVRVTNMDVRKALAVAVKGTGLVAAIAPDQETIMVRAAAGSTSDGTDVAAGIVAGRVTDSASGKGISAATVTVQGTVLKTTTAETGQFTLREVPAGEQVLRVRAFGYKATTEKVTVTDSERTVVQIVLRPSPTVLSGVVTTATGVQERRQIGNDITVLNADSIQRIAPVSTLTDMLEARVPGLTVLRESGLPGAPRRVRLRGTSSLERSNDPIMIVDGIRVNADQSGALSKVGGASNGYGFSGPSPLDQIDPNSIETIEVFKGPSASAMYGADAGNGVIVITTKHGQVGATHWQLNLDAGRTTLPSGGYPVNVFRFGHDYPSATLNNGSVSHLCLSVETDDTGQPACVLDSLVRYQALNDPRFNVFSPGGTRNASLTVRGGSGALTYALTGSASTYQGNFQLPAIEANLFQQQHGFSAPEWMRHPDHYTHWSGTSDMDFLFSPGGASVALTTSYFSSTQQQSSLQSAIQSLLGRYVDTANLGANPLIPEYYTRGLFNGGTLTQGVTLNWPVKSWLPLDATAGLNVGTTDNRSVEPHGYNPADTSGRYSLAQGQSVQQTLNGGTTVLVPRRGAMPAVKIPIGFNWNAQQTQQFAASTQNLPPGVLDPTTFLYNGNTGPTQSRASTTTYGWYVSPTLDMGHGLYWSPGMRFDGGSASGSNAGLSPFPKLDLAWVAIDPQDHLDRPVLGAITLLRPRVAFGIAGVQPDPTQQYRLATYQTVTSTSGANEQVLLLGSYGNTKLKPERSRELEGGFDTELWNQRVTLTLTGYHKLRYDAIETSPLAPSIGVPAGFNTGTGTVGLDVGGLGGTYAYNVGTVRNTGVEATVGARLLDSRVVLWQVNANISKNHEMLLTLAPGVVPATEGAGGIGTRFVPGYPLQGIWAQPIAGYVDANQNGRIDPGEVRLADSAAYLGAPEPNYELTGSTTLSFFNGRLSVNTAVDYQHGLTQTYNAAAVSYIGGSGPNVFSYPYNPYTSALNDPTTPLSQQAAIVAAIGCGNHVLCSPFGLVQTVNTLRWQTFSVNYTVPPTFAQRWAHVNALTIGLLGSNLGLYTNYRGKDPNIGFTPGSNLVSDDGQLPQAREWRLGVTLGH